MLTELRLGNFKAFGEEQAIPLKPLTLIFGTNSAGKSSVLQALLLLKQTLQEGQDPRISLLPRGQLVDLGSFSELVHRHDTEATLSIGLTGESAEDRAHYFAGPPWPLPSATGLALRVGTREAEPWGLVGFDVIAGDTPVLGFSRMPTGAIQKPIASVGFSRAIGQRTGVPSLTRFQAEEPMLDCPFWDDVHEKLRDAIVKENAASQWQQLSKRAVEWGLSKDEQAVVKRRVKAFTRGYPYEDFAKELRSTLERTEARTTQFLPLEVGMRDEPFFWSEVSVATVIRNLAHKAALSVQEWLERTSYVGPIRSAWERVYLFSGNQPSEVGKKGEMVPDLLYSEPAALMNTRKWLRSFSTGYDLKVVRTAAKGMEGVFALRFQDEASGTNVSPADVGFGLSQLLPVIVQGALGRRRTLLIEQPEIHLHPRLQAGLGDFFADCISAPSSNQVIVESHSEHLLLRIQHLVSDGVLSPEQVAVLFIERNPEGARVREVRMDRDGDFIDWWPDDFFEEEFRQSFRGR